MFAYDLSLPSFAFVEPSDHDSAHFRSGRNLIIHIQTLTLMEVFDLDRTLLMEVPVNIPYLNFNFFNSAGIRERYHLVIRATIESDNTEIMNDAAVWYAQYLTWCERPGL